MKFPGVGGPGRGLWRVVLAAVVWASGIVLAVPETIQYQGYLTGADGQPVNGLVAVTFRLFDTPDSAHLAALWEERHAEVAVVGGRFAVALGAAAPFAEAGVDFDEAVYLELEIGAERLLPRVVLHAVPYARRSAGVVTGGVTADMLGDAAVTPGKLHVSLAGTGLAISPSGALRVTTGGITAELIADGAVANRHLAAAAGIDPTKIAGTAVTLAAPQVLENKTLNADINHILNLDLGAFRPGVVLAELGTAPEVKDATAALATAAAVVAYVDAAVEGAGGTPTALDGLTDVTVTGAAAGDLLRFDGTGWANVSQIPATAVALSGDGAVVDDGGLAVRLAGDGTLAIEGNALRVGVIGAGQIGAGAVGTVHIAAGAIGANEIAAGAVDATHIAAGAIGAAHLQDGAVDNTKLAASTFAVNAGSGLAGGGEAALGGALALALAEGGVTAAAIGNDVDVADKGFRAASAAEADLATRATQADLADRATVADLATRAMDADQAARATQADLATRALDADLLAGATLDDGAAAAADVLWSAQRVRDYVDGTAMGLDWQNSVTGIVAAEPADPAAGTRVIAAGVEGWQDHSIYEFDGQAWTAIAPNEGFAVWIEAEDRNYVFNGEAWVTMGSTQNHEALAGLLGGAEDDHWHLGGALYAALTGLQPSRLLAADAAGLPQATALSAWLRADPGSVALQSDTDGGVTLSLPAAVPRGAPSAGHILVGDGAAWESVSQTAISQLGTIVAGTWQGTPIAGEFIELAEDGGLTHGSGLKINLDPNSDSLVLKSGYLTVGMIGAEHVVDGSLSGLEIAAGSLTGAHLAVQSLTIDRLAGIGGTGAPGQPLVADGVGGAMLGAASPLRGHPGNASWEPVRQVPAPVEPAAVVQDETGILYVADKAAHCIRVYDSAGRYLGWLGAGSDATVGFHGGDDAALPVSGSAPGAFLEPSAVAINTWEYTTKNTLPGGSSNRLWVADSGNNRLQAYDLGSLTKTPMVVTGESLGCTGYSFSEPGGLAVLASTLYVADTGNHCILSIIDYPGGQPYLTGWYGSADGIVGGYHYGCPPAGGAIAGSKALQFNSPRLISACRNAGTYASQFAVADTGNSRVMLINESWQTMAGWYGGDTLGGSGWHTDGTPAPGTGDGQLQVVLGVCLYPDALVIADARANVLLLVDLPDDGYDYPFVGRYGSEGDTPGQFQAVHGMARASDGGLWVCDTGNQRLQKFLLPHAGHFAAVGPEAGPVAIGADVPDPSAALHIASAQGGLLIPRRDAWLLDDIPDPAEGLLVYGYESQRDGYGSRRQGLYFWDGYQWRCIGELGYGEVTADKIGYNAVQSHHIDYNAVQAYHIADGTIRAADIATGSITDDRLAPIAAPGKVDGKAVRLQSGGGIIESGGQLGLDWGAIDQHVGQSVGVKGDAAGAASTRVLEVHDDDGLAAALAAFAAADAATPGLIRMAPGVYRGPLRLASHVAIAGSGIGTTVVRATDGVGAIATAVVNASLRDLSIEVSTAADDAAATLVGVDARGSAAGAGLRLSRVRIAMRGSTAAGTVGIASDGSGIVLEQVEVDIDVASAEPAVGLALSGVARVTDSRIQVSNRLGAATGLAVQAGVEAAVEVRQVNLAAAATAGHAAGVRVAGSGEVTIRDCTLAAAGARTGEVLTAVGAADGAGLGVRVTASELRLTGLLPAAKLAKVAVAGTCRVELFSTQVLGSGAVVAGATAGQFRALYSRLDGALPADLAGACAFCTAVDAATGVVVPVGGMPGGQP